MSHFTEMKVNALVKNEVDLIEALKEHFGEDSVEVSDKPLSLEGYDVRAQKKSHIRIRQEFVAKANGGHAYNDIGYERQTDGTYKLHVDPVDMHTTAQQKVAQDYAARVAIRKLKTMGYKYSLTKGSSGQVTISASPMSQYSKY
jgi:hypothetical protein